jgi:KaiC/GvpD/RAD55 family RecA-like ATPase
VSLKPLSRAEEVLADERPCAWTGVYDVAGILARSGSNGPRFLTGLAPLDEALASKHDPARRGVLLGRVLGICGAPWQGKSVLVCQCARELASQGLRVVLLVDDEPREDAAERIGQGFGFRHAELNPEYPGTLERLRNVAADVDLSILPDDEEERPRPTIEEAAEFLTSTPNRLGHVLGLDSLHKSRSRTEGDRDDERTRIDKRMSAVKVLRRHGVLVLFTAEVNRASYASRDPERRQSALAAGAESRSIEYGSDVLLFLSQDHDDDGLVRVELPKNRVGRRRVAFSMRLEPGPARFVGVAEESITREREGRRAEKLGELGSTIVRTLRDAPAGLSGAAIEAERLGARDDVRKALRAAVESGRVLKSQSDRKGGGFVYSLPTPPAARAEPAQRRLTEQEET